MAEVTLTVKQIRTFGLWDKVCEYKGWSPYCLREGLISEDDLVTFDDEFKKTEDIDVKLYMQTETFDEITVKVDYNEERVILWCRGDGGQEAHVQLSERDVATLIENLKMKCSLLCPVAL